MNDGGFIDMINSFFGGAVTTLIGAFTGRLMWHSGEVKLGNRRFFGKELLWEIPVAVGMALIGEAAARYIGLSQPVSTGLSWRYCMPSCSDGMISPSKTIGSVTTVFPICSLTCGKFTSSLPLRLY